MEVQQKEPAMKKVFVFVFVTILALVGCEPPKTTGKMTFTAKTDNDFIRKELGKILSAEYHQNLLDGYSEGGSRGETCAWYIKFKDLAALRKFAHRPKTDYDLIDQIGRYWEYSGQRFVIEASRRINNHEMLACTYRQNFTLTIIDDWRGFNDYQRIETDVSNFSLREAALRQARYDAEKPIARKAIWQIVDLLDQVRPWGFTPKELGIPDSTMALVEGKR